MFISGETVEITNDYIENTERGAYKEVSREKKSEIPNILVENFGGNFPSIIVNKIEDSHVTSQDEDETSELSVSVTSESFETSFVREMSYNFNERDNNVSRIDDLSYSIVKDDDIKHDDVISDDVTRNGVTNSDVISDDVVSSDAISNVVKDDDVTGDNVIGNDFIDSDVIRVDTDEYDNSINKTTGNDTCVDPSDSMESNDIEDDTKNEELSYDTPPLTSGHIEITITEDNSTVQRDFSNIPSFWNEENAVESVENRSHLSKNIIEEAQDERIFVEKGLEDQGGVCKCFHKANDTASEEKLQSKYIEDNSVHFQEQTNSSNVNRTNIDSINSTANADSANLSNIIQDSTEVTETSEDSFAEKLGNSSFASKTSLPTLSLNTAENCASNEENIEDDLSESNNHDTYDSPVNKSYNNNALNGSSCQSYDEASDSNKKDNISIPSTNANIDANEMSPGQRNDDNFEDVSNIGLSKVEDRTLHGVSDDGMAIRSTIPPNVTNSNIVDALEISLSDLKLSKKRDGTFLDDEKDLPQTISDISNDNMNEKKMPKDSTMVENTPKLHDIRILSVDDPDILESKSENNFLHRSLKKRTSSLNSFASSDISSVENERKSVFTEEQEQEIPGDEMDLSSKAGMDKFKEFLTNTKGEALLLFWLEVETWKHIGNNGDKIRYNNFCLDGFCSLTIYLYNYKHLAVDLVDLQDFLSISLTQVVSTTCSKFTNVKLP